MALVRQHLPPPPSLLVPSFPDGSYFLARLDYAFQIFVRNAKQSYGDRLYSVITLDVTFLTLSMMSTGTSM